MKSILKILFNRIVFVALFILVQVALMVLVVVVFSDIFVWFYVVCSIFSLIAAIYVVNKRTNPAYKLAWMGPLLLLPIFGALLYLLLGKENASRRDREEMDDRNQHIRAGMHLIPSLQQQLDQENESAARQARYLSNVSGGQLSSGADTEFLPSGETMYARLLQELRQAKKYIFLEFFIINIKGQVWQSILDILIDKVRQGVEVRILYDDLGSVFTLPANYFRYLRSCGIKCFVVNRLIPVISPRFNNRDHRKICVVDGRIAFTGGINLADEYINARERFGHWKDCGLLLHGDAAWTFTMIFFSMWEYVSGQTEDYSTYFPGPQLLSSSGYVLPYADSPLDYEEVGANAYLNLINRAEKYVYINTPYLAIDDKMIVALTTAARSGVDVRITVPHIPDKKTVYAITRSYFEMLIDAGVRIYEYMPGFNHGKTFVVDDQYAVVGSINLDFRSLYLHYECAAWLYGCNCIQNIKEDYLATLEECHEVTAAECSRVSFLKRIYYGLLRLIAPLV